VRSRRVLCWALLALVLVVGGALRQTDPVDAAGTAATSAAATATHAVHHLTDGGHDEASPCVVRSDCAGAWSFGATGLLLAVAVAIPAVGAVLVSTRVRSAPVTLRSTLMAQRLERPPQSS